MVQEDDVLPRATVACVASVSARFRSKERGTRVKDRAKNGASKRAERGGEEIASEWKRLLRRLEQPRRHFCQHFMRRTTQKTLLNINLAS